MKNNAASRSRRILLDASKQKDDLRAIDVWRSVLTGNDEAAEPFEVVRLSDSLRKELELAERQLAGADVPEETYRPHFDKAYAAVAIGNTNANWKTYKQHITGELLVCLAFSEHIIPVNEPEFDENEIQKVQSLIDELKEELRISDVDPELSHFLRQQIDLLERGFHDLRVKGSKALQRCYIDGLGEIVENAEIISKHSDERIVNKLKNVWDGFDHAPVLVAF